MGRTYWVAWENRGSWDDVKLNVGYIVAKSDCYRDWSQDMASVEALQPDAWSRGQKAQLMSGLSSQAPIVRIF